MSVQQFANKHPDRLPREGTFIRRVLDAALSDLGVSSTDPGMSHTVKSALTVLQDQYLFDVRTIIDPFFDPGGKYHGGRPHRSWIVGRTYGTDYRDFLVENPHTYRFLLDATLQP